jgi:hypothetical protein
VYSLDTQIELYLKNKIFPNEPDLKRIEYATNEFTFRNRARNNNGNLNMPYINYHIKAGGIQFNNDWNWRSYAGYNRGIFLDGVNANVKIMPVNIEYECTFWCNRDDEAKYVANKVIFDLGSTSNPIPFSVSINTQELPLLGKLVVDSTDIDSNFNEKDWFEKNNIHSVGMDFHVMTYMLESDFAISIPDTVIYGFSISHGVDETFTSPELYTFVLDHFEGTVTPA